MIKRKKTALIFIMSAIFILMSTGVSSQSPQPQNNTNSDSLGTSQSDPLSRDLSREGSQVNPHNPAIVNPNDPTGVNSNMPGLLEGAPGEPGIFEFTPVGSFGLTIAGL